MSYGALAAAVGGVVLFISLFIDWAGIGPFSANAWDIFSLMDIVLAAIAIGAIVLGAMDFPAVTLRTPFERHRALTILGIVATTIVWSSIFENDHLKFGIFLAGLASLAILAGGILLERSPREGFAFGGRAAEIAGGGGLGGGGGAAAQPGAYAQPGGYAQPAGQAPATTPLGGGGTAPAAGTTAPTTEMPASAGTGEASAGAVGGGTAATGGAATGGGAAGAGAAGAGAAGAGAGSGAAPQTSPAIQSLPLGDTMPAPPDRPGQPADWYADPTGQKRLRYWDGARWTEHVAD